MRTLYVNHGDSDGIVVVQVPEDGHDAVFLSVTDCDGMHTIDVKLDLRQVGELYSALSQWYDVATRRGGK